MKKFSFAAILLMVAAIASCSKDGIQEDTNHLSLAPDLSSGIDPDVTDISENDAIKVALMSQHQSKTKSEIQKEVQNIIPCLGKDGKVVFYAINYTNGCGYTLVSASKNYYPILAEVEKGSFEENVNQTGVSILLDEYKYAIDNNRSLPADSVRHFRAEWSAFENKKKPNFVTPTKSSDEFTALISSSFAEWTEAGYEIFALGDGAPEGLPQSVYDEWYESALGVANEKYPVNHSAFILLKRETLYTEKGPLLSTAWHQKSPYNLSVPNNLNVGCVAVAVAQILRYHQSPSSIHWAWMPDSLSPSTTSTTYLSDFLYDVGKACGIQYWLGHTSSGALFAKIALKFRYGYSCSIVDHGFSAVGFDIGEGYPVYMEGDKSDGTGHAWVCDGVKGYTFVRAYELKILSVVEPPLHFESILPEYIEEVGSTSHLHMNWGWGGDYNGWYLDDLRHYDQNYSIKRKDIIKIRPKK